MAKRWTQQEDAFLLTWHSLGADFIASHDLGRPNGAGTRRMKALTQSGARHLFAEMMILQCRFEIVAGRERYDAIEEIEKWEVELANALAEQK